MKRLLFFLLWSGIFCSCHKSEPDHVAPAKSYPYKDKYAGMLHIYHQYNYVMPYLTYDSTYPQIFEMVYLDSSRVFFNFYYWDYDYYWNYDVTRKNRIAGYSRSIHSVCGTFPVDDRSKFTIGLGKPGDTATVLKDSLKVDYPVINETYQKLSVSFTGRKIPDY